MSNTYANNITRLCELAFRAYARSIGLAQIANGHVFAGFDDTDVVTPRLIFNADSAEPEGPIDDGNWTVKLEIQCVSNADDRSAEQHHDFASEVFSQFMAGRYTVPDLISAAAMAANPQLRFSCWDIMPGRQAKVLHERKWLSSMEFHVVCCGQNASAGLLTEEASGFETEEGGILVPEI